MLARRASSPRPALRRRFQTPGPAVRLPFIADRLGISRPIEAMMRHVGLPDRSFKRRFKQATGLSPIRYVQLLRIEEAKRKLERLDTPVDDVAWDVGYQAPAFFRRLFKRVAGISPGAYRRKMQLPESVAQ